MPSLVHSHTPYTSPHHEKTVKLKSNNHDDLFSQEPHCPWDIILLSLLVELSRGQAALAENFISG